MRLKKKYRLDVKKAEEGVWVDLDGAKFKLAFNGVANPRYEFELSKHVGQFQTINAETFEGHTEKRDMIIETFVESVLLDWSGVYLEEADVDPLEFSKPTAVNTLKEFPNLFYDLVALASDQARYYFTAEATTVKN